MNISLLDIEPPTIEQCPGTLMFYPEDNQDTAFITWEKPTVVDNKDKGLEAVQLSGPDQATQKGVNSYSIIYGAYDAVGNKADECEFEVIVKRKLN